MSFNSSGSPSTHEDGNYPLSLSHGAWQCVREPFCSRFPPSPPHPDGASRHIQVLGGILKPPTKIELRRSSVTYHNVIHMKESHQQIVYAHKNRQTFNISTASIAADVASSPF